MIAKKIIYYLSHMRAHRSSKIKIIKRKQNKQRNEYRIITVSRPKTMKTIRQKNLCMTQQL